MSSAYDQAAHALNQRNYREAERGFTQVLKDEPENARAMIYLLLARVRQRRHLRSEKLMKSALALAPEDIPVLQAAATINFILGHYRSAVRHLKRARALDPHNSQTHALLAAGYLDQRKKAECEASLNEALRLKPNNLTALHVKGSFETIYYDLAKAEVTATMRLRKAPESSGAHIQSGKVCLAKGDVPQAYWHFREALRLSPHSEEARQALVLALVHRFPVYNWLHRIGLRTKRFRLVGSFAFYYILLRVVIWASSSPDVPPNIRTGILGGVITLAILMAIVVLPMPFMSFALRFHPIGRYAMTKFDMVETVFAAAMLGVGIISVTVALALRSGNILAVATVCGIGFAATGLWTMLLRQSSIRGFVQVVTVLVWVWMSIVAYNLHGFFGQPIWSSR